MFSGQRFAILAMFEPVIVISQSYLFLWTMSTFFSVFYCVNVFGLGNMLSCDYEWRYILSKHQITINECSARNKDRYSERVTLMFKFHSSTGRLWPGRGRWGCCSPESPRCLAAGIWPGYPTGAAARPFPPVLSCDWFIMTRGQTSDKISSN